MAYNEALAGRVRSELEALDVPFTERKMFGGIAFMVRGKMALGVLDDALVARLGDEGGPAALEEPHTRPMDFTGRPMKSMVYIDAAGIASEEGLRSWVERCTTFALSLPPK